MLRCLSAAILAFAPTIVGAQWLDQHSTEAISEALSSPIPEDVVFKAQEFHDRFLATGDFEGVATFLVTDERSARLQDTVERLLTSIGEDPAKWQVRLLDSDPKITNAFVTGGKYVYAFTGLTDEAASSDELAFVLSHELGHSLLKHLLRREQDLTTQLAQIAELAGVIAGGKTKRSLGATSQLMMSAYSRVDEEEADALAVLIARRAGFDPLRGADFFTRSARKEGATRSQVESQVAQLYQAAMAAQRQCSEALLQWNANPGIRTQQNAQLLNSRCADAEARRVHYNETLVSAQGSEQAFQLQEIYRTHPPDRARIAAIAALSDHFAGRRELLSLHEFQQTQRVVAAIRDVRSEWLEPVAASEAENDSAGAEATSAPNPSSTEERLRRLKALLDEGLISKDDYERKKTELLDSL